MFKKMLVLAALAAPFLVLAIAQQPPVKRTPLQAVDFLPVFRTANVAADVAGDCMAADANRGSVTTYILEGAILVVVGGRSPEAFKAAVSFQTPLLAMGVVCYEREARDSPESLWDAPASAGST